MGYLLPYNHSNLCKDLPMQNYPQVFLPGRYKKEKMGRTKIKVHLWVELESAHYKLEKKAIKSVVLSKAVKLVCLLRTFYSDIKKPH